MAEKQLEPGSPGRMSLSRFLREMQWGLDWRLEPDEVELAVAMAKRLGARVVISAWHEFQKELPLRDMQEFAEWFAERYGEDGAVLAKQEGPFADFWRQAGRLPE